MSKEYNNEMSEKLKNAAQQYAESVCTGIFPITYTREKVVFYAANDFMEGAISVSSHLPNDIDLVQLKELLMYSNKYEISIQFWPNQTCVYIAKDLVDLNNFSGNFRFAVGSAINYLARINKQQPNNLWK